MRVSVADIQQIPFFSMAAEQALATLLEQHRLVTFPAGQTLMLEADWGESVMVVLDGMAKVRSFNSEGVELVFALLGPGDLLGEIAVLEGHSRSADVVAMSAIRLLKLPGRSFLKLMHSSTELCLSLAKLEAQRLRNLNTRFAIQRGDATSRVLFTLAYIASKSSMANNPLAWIPSIAMGEIAIIAGLARETSSRVMTKLRGRGDVIVNSDGIRLDSMAPLEKRGIWS